MRLRTLVATAVVAGLTLVAMLAYAVMRAVDEAGEFRHAPATHPDGQWDGGQGGLCVGEQFSHEEGER